MYARRGVVGAVALAVGLKAGLLVSNVATAWTSVATWLSIFKLPAVISFN